MSSWWWQASVLGVGVDVLYIGIRSKKSDIFGYVFVKSSEKKELPKNLELYLVLVGAIL